MDLIEWTPVNEDLNLVVEVLQDSLIPDSGVQKRVQEHLLQMYDNSNFPKYLMYILQNQHQYEEHIRSLSAIILKNNFHTNFQTTSHLIVGFMQNHWFNLLLDPSIEVRGSVSTLIGSLLWKSNLSNWPDLIPKLCNLLESRDSQMSETALLTLFKICEEYLLKRGVKKEENNSSVDMLIAKFISLIPQENTSVRRGLLKSLNQLMQEVDNVKLHLDSKMYINNLLLILQDTDSEVQQLICQAFVTFVELQDSNILLHINTVIEYIRSKSESFDHVVALQACEFWLALTKVEVCKEVLAPYIHRLLPILLKNMCYSSYELAMMKDCVGIDEHLEDKLEDTQPFHTQSSPQYDNNSDYGDGNSYEQTDAVGESSIGWTLRKCSAASLDALAVKFGDSMLQYIFNIMNEALNSNDYIVQESGILALGAIADGCQSGLHMYLPNLFRYLFRCMNSDYSLIRVITCWTMSRYMLWLMDDQQPLENFFVPTMTVLLEHFLDGNKRVQRASLSAFCIFQEEAKLKLVPYIDLILRSFLGCFNKLQFRSHLLLYDAISVLARSVGNYLNKPEHVELLLPPLMYKFETAKEYQDDQFMALMECLSNIAVTIELGFLPYSQVVFNRCLVIISETITGMQCHMYDADECDIPDWQPCGVAHEMLLCLALALKSIFANLVTDSTLITNLYVTMQDEEIPQLRQSALALYGELVKYCYCLLMPTVHDYLPVIIENLDTRYEAVCNNAAWVIGKISIAMGDKITPYVDKIIKSFMEIMRHVNGKKTMYQTVAVSLCTLGLICPEYVAPHLSTIIRPCCQAMRNIGDCDEKDVGFRGLCELIVRNPQAIVNDFIYFCDAVASFEEVKLDVKEAISNILACYKNHFRMEFSAMYDQFPCILKARLNKLYGF